jgi:hypothetical protein
VAVTRSRPWCRYRFREWARRPGASPPMRMTASWSGPARDLPNTRLWRDDPRPMASSPLIVNAPNRFEKSGRDFSSGSPGQGPLVATTSMLGRRDAGRKGATMPRPAQPWSGPKPCRLKPLDTRCPIQGLLRLHSRYGLSDCSVARGDLCHEASARRVAPPDRSSATSANRQLAGWNLPPLVNRAVWAH